MFKRKPKPAKPMAHVKKTHPMWRYGKDPKQPRITSYIGLVLLVVLLIWGIGQLRKFPAWLNDQRMDMLARDVFNTEIPFNTTVNDRKYAMTNMPEERTCAFVVRQDMTSNLTQQEVVSFYKEIAYGLRFPPFAMINQRVEPDIMIASGTAEGGGLAYALSVRIEINDTNDPRCSSEK